MKHKLFAVILALSVVSWAQNTTPAAPADQQKSAEKCACCDKMASDDAPGAKMCMRHGKDAKSGKSCCSGTQEAMSCCGKDSKSCMKAKAGASCCKDCGKDKSASTCCGKDCKGSCCEKNNATAAMNCCQHASHT